MSYVLEMAGIVAALALALAVGVMEWRNWRAERRLYREREEFRRAARRVGKQ